MAKTKKYQLYFEDETDEQKKFVEEWQNTFKKLKKEADIFRQEFSATYHEAMGNQIDSLEEINKVVEKKGSGEHQNALEKFLFGENGFLSKAVSFIKDIFSGIGGGNSGSGLSAGIIDDPKQNPLSGILDKLMNLFSDKGPLGMLMQMLGQLFSKEGPLGGLINMVSNLLGGIFGADGVFSKVMSAIPFIGSLFGGGPTGAVFAGAVKAGLSLGSKLKFHSGGTVPSSGSFEIPGQKEQLALLKGGERVLSPGENVQYKQEEQRPVLVNNNFMIKAWDSKDVSKYLKENKDLIHQMMFEGIKYNNQGLRLMVRNA